MAYKDLRQFIQQLEEHGELNRVSAQVDWDLEVGAISRRAIDRKSGVILFDNVRGYPGHRIMANVVGPTKPVHGIFSLALGLPKETPVLDLIDWFGRKANEAIPPRVVDWAPCKENIVTGNDVNLLDFPVPKIHGTDGGRFIGTWHVDVNRDPDTGWVNWSTYRHMVLDEKRLGWLALPGQHGPGIFYQKFEARGQVMPMAIAIGIDPVSAIAADSGVPAQKDEADFAGALQGEPVEVVRCETNDLYVPASSEIVLECHVVPGERDWEGPFGEFTGYAAGSRLRRPVIHVDCITYRNDPILTMSNMGKPWDEVAIMNSVITSALLGDALRQQGIPFKAIYCPPPSLCPIVAAKSQYAGFIHSVAGAVWSSKAGLYRPYVMLVGEDVDVTNLDEVFWCLTSRLHPSKGIHVQKDAPGQHLFPFLSQAERERWRGARVALDATFPPDWPAEEVPTIMDFENGWPQEVRDIVLSRWSEYGVR
ncbi:MAG: UbiD family decarboxylase [Chloroflexi bacterium]|nr:UbiD family decarboxylase [Chloroflexota bacterium]